MRFDGSFSINAAPEKVWEIVTKPDRFAKAIPDLKSLKVIDPSSFSADFKVKLGMIGGTMKMTFKFEDQKPPSHLRISGRGSGMQSNVDLKIDLDIKGEGSSSTVNWAADLNVGGLVASVGGRLIEGVTRDKVNEIITNFKKVIEKEAAK